MIYGYARVSTKKQLEGNSLEIQEKALLAKGAEKVHQRDFNTFTQAPLPALFF